MGVLIEEKFEGPFLAFHAYAANVVPALAPDMRPFFNPTCADIVSRRYDDCEQLWAKLLLASCPEQTAFLCAIFSPWNPVDDPNLVEALRAGIRAGLFSVLAKFATSGDDHKLAKHIAKALVIGVKHGAKNYRNIAA